MSKTFIICYVPLNSKFNENILVHFLRQYIDIFCPNNSGTIKITFKSGKYLRTTTIIWITLIKSIIKISISFFRSPNFCNIHEFTLTLAPYSRNYPSLCAIFTKLPHIFNKGNKENCRNYPQQWRKLPKLPHNLGQWSAERKYSLFD